MLVANKTYLLLFTVTDFSGDIFFASFNKSNQYGITRLTDIGNGLFKAKVNFSDLTSVTDTLIIYKVTGTTLGGYAEKVMLIPYQEEMENWDIPYFTGMQSVKMPVLKTVGKNLFNESLLNGNQRIDDEGKYVSKTTPEPTKTGDFVIDKGFQEKTTYTFMATVESSSWVNLQIVYTDGTRYTLGGWVNNTCYKTSDGSKTIDFITFTSGGSFKVYDIYLEKGGNTAPTYEPYKSNILTTPEEVVLRSLPNGVCDTLNLNTGEYIKRIGEITANELEASDYYKSDLELENTIQFGMLTRGREKLRAKPSAISMCNIIPIMPGNDDVFHARFDGGTPYGSFTIWMDKTKLETEDVFGLVKWMKDNNAVIQYELAEPVIKTVDLSDNHVYSYKDVTHYDCSSAEGSLVPTLSVKVPTDTQLTIQEQKATTQTLLIKNMDLQQSIKEVQAMNLAFNTALYNSFNSIREEVEDIKKHISTNENLEGSF